MIKTRRVFKDKLNNDEMQETKFGSIPTDWNVAKIEDVATTLFSNVDKKTLPGETPVKLCNYMDVFNNLFIKNDIQFMDASAKQREIDKFTLLNDDVIITKDSEVAEEIAEATVVAEDLKNVICGYHLAIIRPNRTKLDGTFLMYLLHHERIQNQFARLANGITRFGLTIDSVNHALVIFPPLPEQRVIADILSTWDEAIAKTEQLIAALQKRKKGLMQRLLTGEVRFPGFVQSDEKQETKFGQMPADWQIKKISQIGKVNADALGNDGSGKEYYYVELSAVNEGVVTFPTESIAYDDLPSRARRIPHQYDVIMATVRPNLLGYATWDNELPNYLVSTGFALISPKSPADQDFIYQSLYGAVIQRQIHGLVTGSNYPAIKSTEVKKLYLFWPKNPDERKRTGQVFRTIDDEINLHTQKLAALQQQKKGLMQRLLTGEVRVKPERFLNAPW